MHPSFLDTSVIDLLEADPRPSFIVALAPHPPTVVYTNPAFGRHPDLLAIVTGPKQDNERLWEWIATGLASPAPAVTNGGNKVAQPPSSLSSFMYSAVFWTRSVVHEQMAVVGANQQAPLLETSSRVRFDIPAPLDVSDTHWRHRIPVDVDDVVTPPTPAMAVGAVDHTPRPSSSISPALDLRRTLSTPATLETDRTSSPPLRAESVQSLGRSTSDPGWILPGIVPEQRPFLDIIHDVAWDETPLGPMSSWPPRLEQTFNQILVDSRPIALYWGPSYTTIYNEAFSQLCGSKHPAMLGMSVEEAWREAGQRLKEMMQSIASNQRSSVEDEWRFFVERDGDAADGGKWLEETYLKWSIIPICENNVCLGFMHPVVETTSMRLWERRMKMLIDLGEVLVTARDVKSYWDKTIHQLEVVEPRYDIPLAVLYSVEEVATAHGSPAKVCRLEGALGVPEGPHPIAPPTLNLWDEDDVLASLFREACAARHPLLLQRGDGSLPASLLEGLRWRGFEGDACRAAVICPIRPTKEENVMGLLLLALNPRRPYDNDYCQYISLLSQKLTTSLASIVLLEEEARRGRNAAEQAAYDQAMLKEKLAAQTKEANESIQMFEAVAEFVPVGMCFGDPQGNITFANDAWYKITGYPGAGPMGNQDFLSCVKEEDRQTIVAEYEKLKTERNVEFEFRVNRKVSLDATPALPRNSPSFEKAGLDLVSTDDVMERHVLATARAERAADGSIVRVLQCLTDVTAHKRAAEEAVRRAQQAENLKRMAEFATVGMYDMDLEGRLLGANNVFFEMCGLPKVDPTDVPTKPWQACVHKDDYSLLTEKLGRMVLEDKVQTLELRLNTTWAAEDGAGHKVVAPRWVQATLMPVRDTEGTIRSFTGCLSDVSLQKWQLEREKQRKEEAIESKRQQENFIDMTSHEMRNPLGAIVHCADAITATLTRVQELVCELSDPVRLEGSAPGPDWDGWRHQVQELVEYSIDNAETIVGCAQHQKRIVDDILTMSKLDSNLLVITPITVNPIVMVQGALKMFEVEARRVDINLSMVVDQSYQELGVRYLDFDPSRLKQVLINLLTNALKFTKAGPTRNVSVVIGASRMRPSEATSKVQFIPRSQERDDECDTSHSAHRGPPVFLMFEVQDTGQGLSQDEKKSLFQRFVQASNRTHVKYGGSGLGLFISRRLTELQNGAIGVASQPGVGSTFAFYIEAYEPSEAAIREAEANAAAAKAVLPAMRAAVGGVGLGRSSSTSSSHRHTPSSSSGLSTTGLATPTTPRPSPLATSPPLSISSPSPPLISGVLVVEDNLINQQITRRGLISMGFTVDVANHGIECLEKLRLSDRYAGSAGATAAGGGEAFPLSIILMDVEMPVQDGLTCTRNIRELERKGQIAGGRIPIIAVSANARLEQIQEAREAGCDDVLVKPYRMPELLEKMKAVVERLGKL